MDSGPRIARKHLARLRQIHRSSGWPCRDPVEIDLIVGGLVLPERDDQGRETLQVTPAGLEALAEAHATNRVCRSAHDALVMRVAQLMQQEGRIAWTNLALRTGRGPVDSGHPRRVQHPQHHSGGLPRTDRP